MPDSRETLRRPARRTLRLGVAAGALIAITALSTPLSVKGAGRAPAGPLAPDGPVAKAYDAAAGALAAADDNPIVAWQQHRWCETGYRTVGEAGEGQAIDEPSDPSLDRVSPRGFLHPDRDAPMPPGGVRFLDNAWYFGTDLFGSVVVRTPAGLLMFDTLGTPEETQAQVIDQMRSAGLDPSAVKVIFLGHVHGDHLGGANMVRRKYAPRAQFVMGAPDAAAIARSRDAVKAGDIIPVFGVAAPSSAAGEGGRRAYRDRTLDLLPERVDRRVEAAPGLPYGVLRVTGEGDASADGVLAILAPGHTPGQMQAIVPVRHQGRVVKLLVWSGNDAADPSQYAASISFVQGLAKAQRAEAFINTHGYQGATFHHLRRLHAKPKAPNPILMGTDGVQRLLGVFANCQLALDRRLKDGTWKAL